MIRYISLSLASLVFILPSYSSFAGSDEEVFGTPSTDDFEPAVILEGISGGLPEVHGGLTQTDNNADAETFKYQWLLACFQNHPTQPITQCSGAQSCPSPDELRWWLWALPLTDSRGEPVADATWQPVLTECRLTDPPAIVTPRPQVTDALVLTEVRRLGLPRLTVEVQPDEATLVNFETIFYAEPLPWQRTVDLLGYTVDVQAEPTTYVWEFGDGQSLSTQNPGAPYPEKLVTHHYADAGMSVTPRVDTAYAIRYRVDGGAWQSISETVPAAGLPVDLRIREATAVLVGD